jgi:DnaJ-class molecular chaperone
MDETIVFEEELKRFVVLSEKSTYYGLLGIAGDCDKAGIRQNFYALARKFHPDRHMHRPKSAGARQQLMGASTEAYSVLSREERRTSYDRTLTQSHLQTEEEENIDHCFRLATNYQRGGNDVARQRVPAIDHKANKKARLATVHSSIGSAKQPCRCGILTF